MSNKIEEVNQKLEEKIVIYTDGSSGNKTGKDGGIGVVLLFKVNGKIMLTNEYAKGFYNTSNNRMELHAVLYGLSRILDKNIPVTVKSDSQYVVDAFAKGYLNIWNLSGWTLLKNGDLWHPLYDLVRTFKQGVKFVWVRGHNGVYYNEVCDRLATQAKKESKVKKNDISTKNWYKYYTI